MDAHPLTPSRIAYPINETAQLLGMSRRTIYELISCGELRSVRIGARQRVHAAELERLTRPQEHAA